MSASFEAKFTRFHALVGFCPFGDSRKTPWQARQFRRAREAFTQTVGLVVGSAVVLVVGSAVVLVVGSAVVLVVGMDGVSASARSRWRDMPATPEPTNEVAIEVVMIAPLAKWPAREMIARQDNVLAAR